MIARCQAGAVSLGNQLAAAGKYAAALRVLDAVAADELTDELTLETKLLRAKILSQQGEFAKAVEAWREVVAAAPDDAEARRALELADRLRERGCQSASPRRGVLLAGCVLFGVLLGLGLAYALGRNAGIAAAVASESVHEEQAARLDTANGLVGSLQSILTRQKADDGAAARRLETLLTDLDQQVATVEQSLRTVSAQQKESTAELGTTLQSLGTRLDEARSNARDRDAEVETRLADIAGRLAEQLAQVQETSQQTRTAVEHLSAGQNAESKEIESCSKALEALRRDLAPALSLAKAVRSLQDTYERIALRRGYVSHQEHAEMRRELSRLCDQADLLLDRIASSTGRLGEQLAQVQETSRQMRTTVEDLSAGQNSESKEVESCSKALEALRRDLAPALSLAKAVRSLQDSYERIVRRRGYVSRQEHAEMCRELSRLSDQADLLLDRIASSVSTN